jgi:CheY-like chemotaxis protein/two-component sensor histidine kinase
MKLRQDGRSTRERDVIERQLGHLTRLVDDLLDVSRVTRGKLDLARIDIDISEVISRAVEMASPLLEERSHALTVAAEPHLLIHADPARLAQVVANLLTNAAKYTPPRGRVAVIAKREGDEVVIRVEDDGEGISPELLPDIFDLFVQGKRTFDRSQGGLGIGLALVKNLVALHGGKVSASSPGPGRGSTFELRLPSIDLPGSARAARDSRPGLGSTEPAGRRILVVDDNRDAAELLAEALGDLGYRVDLALDGVAALERLRENRAEAAVLDLGLPVMDGFELARRIHEEYGAKRPRLIALTGYGQAHDRERSREAGFDVHLVKPVDLAAVVQALEAPSASSA